MLPVVFFEVFVVYFLLCKNSGTYSNRFGRFLVVLLILYMGLFCYVLLSPVHRRSLALDAFFCFVRSLPFLCNLYITVLGILTAPDMCSFNFRLPLCIFLVLRFVMCQLFCLLWRIGWSNPLPLGLRRRHFANVAHFRFMTVMFSVPPSAAYVSVCWLCKLFCAVCCSRFLQLDVMCGWSFCRA